MRVAIKLISSAIGLYSIGLLVLFIIGEYFTYNYLTGVNGLKLVFGYPLFLYFTLLISMLLGIVAAIGLFKYKKWGIIYLNLLVAINIIIHIFQVIEKFFPGRLGYILFEHDSGAVFYTNKFEWYNVLIMITALAAFLFINSKKCKKVFQP